MTRHSSQWPCGVTKCVVAVDTRCQLEDHLVTKHGIVRDDQIRCGGPGRRVREKKR